MGEWAQPPLLSRIKLRFLLNRYNVFQFIGVDYGVAKRTGPPQERREAVSLK